VPKPVLPVAVKERKYDRKEMKEFLYRLYVLEGKSLGEIGKEFGVSKERVRQLLKSCRIKRRRRGREFRGVMNVEIAKKLYEQGWSLQKIAGFLGVSVCSVRKYLLGAGVKMRKKGWKLYRKRKWFAGQEGKKQLWDLYVEQGLSTCKISQMFGVSAVIVYKRLKEYGIPVRTCFGSRAKEVQEMKCVVCGGRGDVLVRVSKGNVVRSLVVCCNCVHTRVFFDKVMALLGKDVKGGRIIFREVGNEKEVVS